MLTELGTVRCSEGTLEQARAKPQLTATVLGAGPALHARRSVEIPVGAGVTIRANIYDPVPTPASVLVWLHGGGWVLGDVDDFDAVCATIARDSGLRVVSVNYRLAPEHRYPTAVEDALAALRWVDKHLLPAGGSLNIGGDSAGGNLAAVVARRARDEQGPALTSQVLVYPVTDHHFERDSYTRYATDFPLGRQDMMWFWNHYLPDVTRRSEADASPVLVDDLGGLPAAHVVLASHDVLVDEGRAYAEALRKAGVAVQLDEWDGMIHGFFNMVGYFDVADAAVSAVCQRLQALAGRQQGEPVKPRSPQPCPPVAPSSRR